MGRINRGNVAASAGAVVLAALTIGWWLKPQTRPQPSSVGLTVPTIRQVKAAVSGPDAAPRPSAVDSVVPGLDDTQGCGEAWVSVGANGELNDPAKLAEFERVA